MPVEYQALAFLTIFFTLAWVPVSAGKFGSFGIKWLASNRHESPKGELAMWAQRCDRAYNNLKDYFPAFVVAILLLGATNKFDETTGYAAIIFVVARLIHYISYGIGLLVPRFLTFAIGLIANIYLLIKVLI
ncbi:MAG TPA: MAPEG family protein [Bacteriovoracaceae bacterium]|nr:MAPEG family protein [Bacteriovoracaceae bacterium]